MNSISSRLIGTGLLFLLIFLSGFWLSRSGKPYPVILFTLHKLIALGAVIFLGIMIYKVHQVTPFQTSQVIAMVISAVCLLCLMVTGGLVSVEKSMPDILLRVHQIVPYLTLVSVGVTLYLLLLRGSQITSISY